MGTCKPTKRYQSRLLKPHQKEFVLDCIAAGWSCWEIIEALDEEYGIKKYNPSSITHYRKAHAEEIERRRELWREDLRLSGLPFVRPEERISRYGRFAKIEMKRKRYKDAADQMRRIAEETGDLKQTSNVNLGLQDESSDSLLGVVQGALERVNAEGAAGGGGAGEGARTPD